MNDKLLARYDLDNSGAIDKSEMVNVMRSIHSMVDGNIAEAQRGNMNEKVHLCMVSFVMPLTLCFRQNCMQNNFSD